MDILDKLQAVRGYVRLILASGETVTGIPDCIVYDEDEEGDETVKKIRFEPLGRPYAVYYGVNDIKEFYCGMFTEAQIAFMRSIGIDFDFENLSDDDFCIIEETLADKLAYAGFDKDYNVTDVGRMCENILALLP